MDDCRCRTRSKNLPDTRFHLEHYCYTADRYLRRSKAAPYLVQLVTAIGSRAAFSIMPGATAGGVLKCATHAHTLDGIYVIPWWCGIKGNRLVFRYYDPRVLRVYLPTCTPDELNVIRPDRAFLDGKQCAWYRPGFLLEYDSAIEAKPLLLLVGNIRPAAATGH
jgi:hypothetical protein